MPVQIGAWFGTHTHRWISTLFDVRVFHPNAPSSYCQAQVASRHELEKKREYGDRTHVDGESFTPLVFSTFGGLGKEATNFYNRMANLLAIP